MAETLTTESRSENPWWWRLLTGSWRIQMAFTLILWASLLNVGFGAVFFVCASLYWLCIWGTEARRRRMRAEGNTVLAGWYFDNSRIL
uniref:Golgi apparatus membrane protein TVP23 homolog n=1 Tax=Mesocestoides corti TaxID=53468 RepID=A0A5K3EQ82_MESCO